MNKILEGKRLSIKKKARKERFYAIKLLGIIVIVMIVVYFLNMFLKFGSFGDIIPFFLPILFGFFLVLSGKIFDPLSASNKVILNLINSVEYLEKSIGDPNLVNDAYEQLLLATDKLESMERGEASYYSEIRQKELKLISNLKNLIAPAMLIGEVTHIVLEEIALLFTEPNAFRLETMNQNIEKQFKPVDVTEKKPEGIIDILLEKTIGKLVLSFFSGFGVVLSLTWLGCRLSEEFARQVRGNLFGLFGICITLTVGFMALLRKT